MNFIDSLYLGMGIGCIICGALFDMAELTFIGVFGIYAVYKLRDKQ